MVDGSGVLGGLFGAFFGVAWGKGVWVNLFWIQNGSQSGSQIENSDLTPLTSLTVLLKSSSRGNTHGCQVNRRLTASAFSSSFWKLFSSSDVSSS